VNIQLSISSHGTEKELKEVERKLRDWHQLEKRRQQLERMIPEQEKRLADLKDKLTASSILSSIIQQTENMDMPRGSGTSDRVGDLVAGTLDKAIELEARIQDWRFELARIYGDIADIELEVSGLSERHQRVVTMYYRDRLGRRRICEALYISERRMYDMLNEAIRELARWKKRKTEVQNFCKMTAVDS
jgi:DNA-directed RNA polymerase specialized sigma subunit